MGDGVIPGQMDFDDLEEDDEAGIKRLQDCYSDGTIQGILRLLAQALNDGRTEKK